jgi:phage terminase large subunit-like protein
MGAEVYSAATTKDQAKFCFDESAKMVRKSPALHRYCDVIGGKPHSRTNNISVEALGSKFEPLSADADTKDGLNIHGAILDELHKWKDPELFEVIETGTGARTQPLIFAITTPGSGEDGICWEQRAHVERILEQVVDDDAYFGFICEPARDLPFDDPKTWEMGNPSIDTIVQRDDLQRKSDRAKELVARQNAFRRLHCGQWTEQVDRWIDLDIWRECGGTFDPAILAGRPAYGGLDLASTKDLSSFVLAFPPIDERPWTYFLAWTWFPSMRLDYLSRTLKQPISKWIDDGWIESTDGDATDYEVIRNRIKEASDLYDIREIAFDPWNAADLVNRLIEIDGFEMIKNGQGTGGMSAPSKGFERLLLQRRIRHGDNPIFTFCAKNVAIWTDANDNIKPSRRSSGGKIDTILAAIMASGRADLHDTGASIWETEEALG